MSYASLKLLRLLFACVLAMSSPVDASLGVLDYVNPFIGTSGGGWSYVLVPVGVTMNNWIWQRLPVTDGNP